MPSIKKLSELNLKRTSYIYSADEKIAGRFFYENRDPVKYKDVPSLVKNAFIAAEDKRFFSHYGIDPIAITRAWLHNKMSRRIISGASTITQQLVRLLYEAELEEFKRRDLTLSRKIKEVRLAVQLERHYSKEQIFEIYINFIYLGHGRFGIVEACRYYFDKELNELTATEAALIAGVNKSAAKFSPLLKEKASLERRNLVLLLMKENEFINELEYNQAVAEPIKLKLPKSEPSFDYAKDFVRRVLLEKGYDSDQIWHNGGLKVKTTIDSRVQKIAADALSEYLAKLNADWGNTEPKEEKLEGAVVVIENFSGKIAAIIGGHDFAETKYNRAVQKSAIRQPGSAFKIFTYATALKEGWSFYDKICDCPIHLPGKISFHGKVLKWWSPKNFHEKSHPDFMGFINLWQGLVLSRNVATIYLARRIGIEKVIETAYNMGIESELDPYLPTAIGASSVGLLELTAAYSVFSNNGAYLEPIIVTEIEDTQNQLVYKSEQEKRTVLASEVAEDMTVLMRGVTEVGTAKLTFKGIEQKVAGKTGTTNESRDVLFFGFTPGTDGYTIGVRLGYDTPKSIGARQTGGLLAAPICRKIVEEIYKNRQKNYFSPAVEEKLHKLINPQTKT